MKKRTRKRIMSAFLALCITASVGTCGLSAQAAQPSEDTMDGEESAVYELNTKSESFFDIGDYVPEREGYTFAGWCYKVSALYDSLIEDTSNYDWMNNTSGLISSFMQSGRKKPTKSLKPTASALTRQQVS